MLWFCAALRDVQHQASFKKCEYCSISLWNIQLLSCFFFVTSCKFGNDWHIEITQNMRVQIWDYFTLCALQYGSNDNLHDSSYQVAQHITGGETSQMLCNIWYQYAKKNWDTGTYIAWTRGILRVYTNWLTMDNTCTWMHHVWNHTLFIPIHISQNNFHSQFLLTN